ncbi:helicase-exonuclease AddAB subunit AddB [Dehalobacter sp. DCM]|uniref:helicase-exonuclease AddAB subunit AddB n=1 Tax=Dehalobacter sp. DCM TaxID=2907827 RepID=UPI003081CE52|nr:helicase-exonuclease AddAB subunit AddB [Dehalobacter sp. DCM]
MSLKVIFGRAGSGKSYYCLHAIKEQIKRKATGKPLILLVPEQYTLQAEKDLIAVLETGGILEVEVLSFRRLAFRVFNEAGGIAFPHIHSAGKSMILFRILAALKDELTVFAHSADRKGFVSTLSALMTELKRYHIGPEDLQKAEGALADTDPLKDKLKEIRTIYAGFEETIRDRYRDSDDDLTLAASKMVDTDLFRGAEIWIDGFAGFTPQEYLIIAKLLTQAEKVNITLCTESLTSAQMRGTDVFAEVKGAYRKLVNLVQEYGCTLEPAVNLNTSSLPRFQDSLELSHLERYYSAYPYPVFEPPTKDISLLASVNPYAEIEAAAGEIVRLCRDGGLRFRDIAVLSRNLTAYEGLIETVFSEYGIPYFLDKKTAITDHPLVRMILAMLDIFSENWSYEAVFRYLKTGLTGLEQEDIDHIENYVLACGIRGNRWTMSAEWEMIPEMIPEENLADSARAERAQELAEINRIRNEIIRPLLAFRQKTKNRRLTSEIGEALYDFLCGIGVPERIEAYQQYFKDNGLLELANEYSQVWNIVMHVLDQTVEVMGDDALTLEKFADTLTIGLAEYTIGIIPASLDQVLIGSIERFRSHDLKALLILGVNDGVFPAAALAEGIISDQDRASLNRLGIELANDTQSQAFNEQYLVYRALTTASHYLRLSWPIADQEGKSLRPSMIIYRLRKLFPQIKQESNLLQTGTGLDSLAGQSPAFRQMVAAFRLKAEGQAIEPWWQDVYRWYEEKTEWQAQCRAVHDAFFIRNLANPVSPEKIRALYGETAYASVSRLEKYTSCQFAFYLQYGLKAKERRLFQFRAPDVGTFMHAVIETFSRQAAEGNLLWRDMERDWCREQVTLIVDVMLNSMQGSGLAASKRYAALAGRLKRVITRAVWMIVEHLRRSGFEPLGYELGFGEGEKFPPIVIELGSGQEVHLVGRIDRVDALKTEEGTYLRIVDYKSGNKDFKLADVYYGLQIQLITYLDALWENQALALEQPVLPGGILYFQIDDPFVKSNGKLSETEIEQKIMKQLKMKGLLLADVKLIKEMDRTIDGSSLIIPARINKDDSLGKSSAASLEQFQILRRYVKNLLQGLCEEIMSGNVAISPYKKKGTTSCKYCSYAAVCQFDPSRKENTFRLLTDKKDEEVWGLLGGQ